jgi:hypothetical protein
MIEFESSWAEKDKLFAFPISELKRDKDGKEFALAVTKETLGSRPSIEKSRFDKVDLSDQSWLQATGGGTGATPGTRATTGTEATTGAAGSGGPAGRASPAPSESMPPGTPGASSPATGTSRN